MHQPNLYYITYRSRSVARPSAKSPTARTLFMDPQVLPTPLGFVISKLKIPRKRVLHFTNAVVKVLFRRQNKRSRVLSVSIFMFSFAFDFKVTIISVSVVIFLSSRSLQHMWQTSRCYWYSFGMVWTIQERLPHLQFHRGQIWTACT